MPQPSPYSGNETALKIAELIKGFTAAEIQAVVWEARLLLAPEGIKKLEEIFDEGIAKLREEGCADELIASYLREKTEVIKSMLAQCIHWEKEIPDMPFFFKGDGKVNYAKWSDCPLAC